MNPRTLPALLTALAIGAVMAQAAVIDKGDNADALNLTTSWDGGVVPGADDIARWPIPATQNLSTSLGAPLTFGGLVVTNGADNGYNTYTVTLRDNSNTLTLGRYGLVHNGKKALAFYAPLSLAADQTWRSAGGYVIFYNPVALNGHTLTLDGGQTFQPKTQFTGEGTIVNRGASVRMENGAAAPDANAVILLNRSINLVDTPATGGAARFRSVTLDGTGNNDGATLNSNSDKSKDSTDIITGAIAVRQGNGTVSLSSYAAHHLTMEAGSLSVASNAFLHVKGTQLGQQPASANAAGYANLLLTSAPALVGGTGGFGSQTLPILRNAVVSTNTSDYGNSLATYDSTYGLRPLNPATEYASALPLGQTTLANVRLVNDGTAGTSLQTLLPDGLTAVNSLLVDVSGAAGTGGYILDAEDGASPTLRVNSGMVYVRNTKSSFKTAGDEIPFQNFTLDLNGHGGVFTSLQTGNENMGAKAWEIRCPIVNDGGEGVNFCSVQNRGFTYLYGSADSTYTGPTRLVNGNLKLSRNSGNAADLDHCIPGDLEIYSGTCQNVGNTIPDTSDIRIYGGSLIQKGGASNSGSGAPEVFRDLTMWGGSCTLGASGTSSGSTTLRNATLFSGTLTQTRGHRLTATGVLTLAGGTNVVNRWEKSSNRTLQYLQGGISITNTPSGAYQPMHFDAGTAATSPGAKSTLSVGIDFTGNSTNDNTTVIAAAAPGEGIDWAQFLLDGSLVFNIGDGAADIDLRIEPQLVDNGTTVGSLQKTGAGTLALVNPASSFTGATSVQAGVLVADGALAGDVTVANGATFQAGSIGDTGSVALGGNLTLANGARLRVRHDGTAATLGRVVGTVTSAGKTYVSVEGADESAIKAGFKFMEAHSFSGEFVCTDPKVSVVKRNNGTELWLRATASTVVLLR